MATAADQSERAVRAHPPAEHARAQISKRVHHSYMYAVLQLTWDRIPRVPDRVGLDCIYYLTQKMLIHVKVS